MNETAYHAMQRANAAENRARELVAENERLRKSLLATDVGLGRLKILQDKVERQLDDIEKAAKLIEEQRDMLLAWAASQQCERAGLSPCGPAVSCVPCAARNGLRTLVRYKPTA